MPDGRQAFETVSIGQKMCVSSDINIPNPPADDRPYAGWLYASFGSHLASRDRLDSFAVNLGVVGPMSLAEDAQKLFHSIIDADWPEGWHNQIENEPAIILAYEHVERLYRAEIADGLSTDVLGSVGGELGNAMTQARKFIASNQDQFGDFIKGSPLYVPPVTEIPQSEAKPPLFDYDNPDNALFVFRPQALNRH